jgi:hypothetical protein
MAPIAGWHARFDGTDGARLADGIAYIISCHWNRHIAMAIVRNLTVVLVHSGNQPHTDKRSQSEHHTPRMSQGVRS